MPTPRTWKATHTMKRSLAGIITATLSLSLALTGVPTSALAQVSELVSPSASTTAEPANSWRYENGVNVTQPADAPTASPAASRALQAYAATTNYGWKASYGTSYLYDMPSPNGGGGGKTAVSGAKSVIIDVSFWNGAAIDTSINWKKVAADGVTGAIIRCGYGSDTSDQDDVDWLTNVKGAQAAGLQVGVYLYSYATKANGATSSAASEAAHVLRCLQEAGLSPSAVSLPVYYDLEDSTQSGYSKTKLANMATTFCSTIQAAGYKTGIYANTSWWNDQLTKVDCAANGWSKWVAQYNKACTYCVTASGKQDTMDNYGAYLDLWQFTSSGHVSGIDGYVDVSFAFTTFNTSFDYTISYALNGGTNSSKNPTGYNAGTTLTLAKPTYAGYTFGGWYTNKALTVPFTGVTEATTDNVKLYAKWTAKAYTVTYKVGKGTLPAGAKTAYKVTTSTFSLPVPTRTGYAFVGWYKTSARSGTAVTQVKKGTTGNKVYYAKWVKGYNATVNITGGKLNVRKSASLKAKVVATYKKGAMLAIRKVKGSWAKVYKVGWVRLDYLSHAAKVRATVKVYAGNSTSSKAVAKLKKGAKVTVLKTKGDWSKVKGQGWVKKTYLKAY